MREVLIGNCCCAGSTLNHWPFPADHLLAGYCYIITHPGSPCIFYDHFMAEGLGESIREMIAVRQKMRLHCRSKVPCNHHIMRPQHNVWSVTFPNCGPRRCSVPPRLVPCLGCTSMEILGCNCYEVKSRHDGMVFMHGIC